MNNEEKFICRKEIIKDHDIRLLAELLYFSYINDDNFNIDYVINIMNDSINYSNEERKEMIDDSIKIIKDKYNIDINDRKN